ncbi:hypothetical protein EDB19DRAFT_1837106 [Suillus lakei]|nr:hypothetical protein EDB19DRAFT_1837106 [Suillus lakei]
MSDNPINVDDLDKPNIPGVEQEIKFIYGDLDEAFQGSGESNGQVSEEGTRPTGASDFMDWYPEPSESYGKGYTFLNLFNSDENSMYHAKNPYYPFSGWKDWEIVSWLLCSGLSMGKIDSFLSLEMSLSRSRVFHYLFPWPRNCEAEQKCCPAVHAGCPKCSPQVIPPNHPLFYTDFTPPKVYTTAQCLCCVYSEWMTGNDAWNMQSALSKGTTLLGTILSSNETNLSTMTGDRIVHPLLVSLANISMSTQLKTLSNSFILTALLPIPKFIHIKKCMQGVLKDHLIHECLDIILHLLKQAACDGVMLSDPVGHSCYCFTPLASYIINTPEAMMLATVSGKTSLVTMAMFKQFRDPVCHKPHTKSTTLAQLAVAQIRVDPSNIEAFFREAQKFRLNSVFKPFWQVWERNHECSL